MNDIITDNLDVILEEAHEDYILRKNEIISKLKTMKKTKDLSKLPIEWIDQIINFIEEKEI